MKSDRYTNSVLTKMKGTIGYDGFIVNVPCGDVLTGFLIEAGSNAFHLWVVAQPLYEPIDRISLLNSYRLPGNFDYLPYTLDIKPKELETIIHGRFEGFRKDALQLSDAEEFASYLVNRGKVLRPRVNPHNLRIYGLVLAKLEKWEESLRSFERLLNIEGLPESYKEIDYIGPIIESIRNQQYSSVLATLEQARSDNLKLMSLS